MKPTVDGLIRLYVDERISIDEMREWSPARIELFFNGLALMQSAVNNVKCEWSEAEIEKAMNSLAR